MSTEPSTSVTIEHHTDEGGGGGGGGESERVDGGGEGEGMEAVIARDEWRSKGLDGQYILKERGEIKRDDGDFSDVNLATPLSEPPTLEFFDRDITASSDSSDVVGKNEREGRGGGGGGGGEESEGEGGGSGGGGEGEIVKVKPIWPRQKEARKILDLESAMDTTWDVSGEEEDYRDLKATIAEREKHGTRTDSYITYKIVTENTRGSHLYSEAHYDVWRRYRDFEWLQAQIERSYQTLIVPPLPGKQLTRYFDHMSDAFLDERQKALSKFLWRLTVHPYFSFSADLKVFLTASREELASHIQEVNRGNKLLGRVSSSVKLATTALMLKEADPEFAKQSKYFAELADKMGTMERIASRLHNERESLHEVQEDLSVSVFQWAANENALTQTLQKLASCVEKCNTALKDLNEANAYSLMAAVREYQLYSASAVAAIRRRDSLQREQERTTEDREKKRRSHNEATAAGKIQKVTKLADDLEKFGLAAEQALDSLSQANEQLRVDIEKWHEAKCREVCQFMRKFSNNHVEYHQKCFNEWEQVLHLLRESSVSPVPVDTRDSPSPSPHVVD